MNSLKINVFLIITALFISACGDKQSNNEKLEYQEISWIDLDPNGEKLLEYYTQLSSLDELTDDYNADLSDEFDSEIVDDGTIPPQAHSVGVVAEMDGKNIRVPGFIVPVEFEEGNLVTEFFLVPYFGACFHQPPPPPNQTIYVISEKPVKFESIYDPVWVMGVMNTEQTGNDIATAAYKVNLKEIEAYTDFQ